MKFLTGVLEEGGLCPGGLGPGGVSVQGVPVQGGLYQGRVSVQERVSVKKTPIPIRLLAGSTYPTGMHSCVFS